MPEVFYSASQEYLDTSQFDRLGHPGRYSAVQIVQGTEFHFTGSMFGYGAIMVGSSGSNALFAADDKVTLSGGGDVLLKDLAKGPDDTEAGTPQLFEFSVAYVSASEDAPNIYVFKRQQ